MDTLKSPSPVILADGEGARRWFYGGAVFTWKVTAEQTDGAFFLKEDEMVKGKLTPLHTHPVDEAFYVLEGEILMHMDGVEHVVGAGGFVMAPRGVPHAFMVTSEVVRTLSFQAPASCQSFYVDASEPMADDGVDGVVDFDRIYASAQANSDAITILGPPPFAQH